MQSNHVHINLISSGTDGLSSLLQELAKYQTINEVFKAYP